MVERQQSQLDTYFTNSEDAVIVAVVEKKGENQTIDLQLCNKSVFKILSFFDDKQREKDTQYAPENQVTLNTPIFKLAREVVSFSGSCNLSSNGDENSIEIQSSEIEQQQNTFFSLADILKSPEATLGMNTTRVAKVIEPASSRSVQISIQSLMFNSKQCQVLTCRDITQIKQNVKLSSDNKMLSLMSSAVSHEMITPIKCMISMTGELKNKITDKTQLYNVKLIETTSKMLLN